MNKKTIVASLNKIANELDQNGLYKEANTVTKVMSRLAYDFDERDYHNDKRDNNYDDMGYCPECEELTLIDGVCDQCGYGEDDDDNYEDDYDMGPEKEPFDYDSPEDEGDMYGDDMKGHFDKDTDF